MGVSVDCQETKEECSEIDSFLRTLEYTISRAENLKIELEKKLEPIVAKERVGVNNSCPARITPTCAISDFINSLINKTESINCDIEALLENIRI